MYQISADSWYITIFFSKITPVFGSDVPKNEENLVHHPIIRN